MESSVCAFVVLVMCFGTVRYQRAMSRNPLVDQVRAAHCAIATLASDKEP